MQRILILAAFSFPFLATTASAHNVGVSWTLRGGKVDVEAFYDDDTAAAKAKVKVVNAQEEIVATGVTDDLGRWTFAAPAPGKYEIHVDAGAGHRAHKTMELKTPTPAPQRNDNASDQSLIDSPSENTRADFTRTPWLKIAIGLIVIVGFSGAFVIASRIRKREG